MHHYKVALDEVEDQSQNYYSIVGNMMQIYHSDASGVKAKPDKVVKYARILEAQNVQRGMQALSYLTLAECSYAGRGLSKDLTVALEYAQKASLQSYNRVAQEQGLLLVKQIIEERNNEARERDRDHISKITEEKKKYEEEARRASEALLKSQQEREELLVKLEQARLQSNTVSAASPANMRTSVFTPAAAATQQAMCLIVVTIQLPIEIGARTALLSASGAYRCCNVSITDARWHMGSNGIDDKTARLWDLRDTNNICSYQLQGHTDYVLSVSLTPDGKWALTGSRDNTARLWDLRDTNSIRSYQLQGHTGGV